MKVGIFGGGFKPFTTGHFSKVALALHENDLVVLYYAVSARQKGSDYNFTADMSMHIYEIVKSALEREFGKKIIVELGAPTPIVKMFKFIEAVKNCKDNECVSMNQLGIDIESIDQLTIYSDSDDIKRFTSHIGTEKEEKYFGKLFKENRLKFDTGSSDDNILEIERMIAAMRDYYPGETKAELIDLIKVRGTDIRTSVLAKEKTKIEKYLPRFLTKDEKTKIIEILFLGLKESKSEYLRYLIGAYVREVKK